MLPRQATFEKPRRRRVISSSEKPVENVPVWPNTETPDGGIGGSLPIETLKPNFASIVPMLFGPISRMPRRAHSAASRDSRRRPASPASPKPPDNTMTYRAPASAAFSTTASTCACGVATTTNSGGFGHAETVANAGRPSIVPPARFTG